MGLKDSTYILIVKPATSGGSRADGGGVVTLLRLLSLDTRGARLPRVRPEQQALTGTSCWGRGGSEGGLHPAQDRQAPREGGGKRRDVYCVGRWKKNKQYLLCVSITCGL